jgi:hypothetical protein
MRHKNAKEKPDKPLPNLSPTSRQPLETRGDIQATTKVADCRSLQSPPPKFSNDCPERLLWQASIHMTPSRVRSTVQASGVAMPAMPRDPASSSTAASFCEAGRRCQGRCLAHEVRAHSPTDTLRKNQGLFFKIFSDSGASIVETGLKCCAGCRCPLQQ